jgi:outer membrane protein
MRVKISAICFLVVLMIKAHAQQGTGSPLTLQQSVELAIRNNPDIKQSELSMQTANINLKQAKGNLLPDITGTVGHGINQGRNIDPFTNTYINQQVSFANYGLNAGVTLFSGLQLLNNIKMQALNYDATKMELQQAKDNITLQVILAYLDILRNEDQLVQARARHELSGQQVARLELLHKEGAIAPSLLYDLRGQLANDELSIVSTTNALDLAKLNLAQLMNVPYDKNLKVERLNAEQFSLVYEGDPETIYQSAVEQLGFVKAAEFRRQSAGKALKVARGWYYPSVGLNGGLGTNYSSAASTTTFLNTVDVPTNDYVVISGNKVNVISPQSNFSSSKISYMDQFRNNYGTSVSINLRFPILNGFFARNQVAQAKVNLKNAEFVSQTAQTQLRQLIDQAYFNMKAAQDRYRVLQQQVDAFTQSFHVAEVRFNAGLGTSVDYLVAKNNVDQANINLVVARYDYALRMKILDYFQSKPLW